MANGDHKDGNNYLFDDLLINGGVFAIYSFMGPEPIFYYPIPTNLYQDYKKKRISKTNVSRNLSKRTLLQVAVKSVSLLLSDYSFTENNEEELKKTELFGILPYPDIKSVSLTYFTYYYSKKRNSYMPCTLSLLVKENKRSFLYDNINRLKEPIGKFVSYLKNLIYEKDITSEQSGKEHWDMILPKFIDFFKIIREIQEMPLSPITKKRRVKILFTGLENTGKTSFLLTLNKSFSKLIKLRPTTNPMKEPLNFLGTTIMKWDIPGQKSLRETILKKSDVYLFETDVLYYFIDVQNPRIEQSRQFLVKIKQFLDEYDERTPIIFIITKVDEDIANSKEIRSTIHDIKQTFKEVLGKNPYAFFETSIFSIYTILNAFSFGIRQLSPNHRLINHLLGSYMRENDLISALLVNEDGIVLGGTEIKDPEYNEVLSRKQIFEITASQFTSIAKQFEMYYTEENTTKSKYLLSKNDLVLLNQFNVEDFTFFLLSYTKKPEHEKEIQKNIPKLVDKLKNLLELYC